MKIRTGIEKLGKGMILLIFSIFTIFPFVWMILSALKTKAEIMDVRSFFRQNSSGITFTRSFLNHRFFDMSATVCLYQ
ncbi:MAG: hypothetical protein ACLT5U_14380 [Mediterraneibacter gnavus]